MVVKALSWALRALWIREPTAVAKFIDTNECGRSETSSRRGLKTRR
jgi:hypothetical protein